MNHPKITPELTSKLEAFFEFMPPAEFREGLVEFYHSYILNQHESFPANFKRLSQAMILFLDLLKCADELNPKTKTP